MVFIQLFFAILFVSSDFALGQNNSCPSASGMKIRGLGLELTEFYIACTVLRDNCFAEAATLKSSLESAKFRQCKAAIRFMADPEQIERKIKELGCETLFNNEKTHRDLMVECNRLNHTLGRLNPALYADVASPASTLLRDETDNNLNNMDELKDYFDRLGCKLKWQEEAHESGLVTWRQIESEYLGALKNIERNGTLSEALQEARRASQFGNRERFCSKYLPVPDHW